MTRAHTHNRTSVGRRHAKMSESELPAALSCALVEFGLLTSFRRRQPSRQREYVSAVMGVPAWLQAKRIADVLDELAHNNLLYQSKRSLQS